MHTTFSLTTPKVSSMPELTCRVVSEDATHRTGRLRVLPAADGPRSIMDRTRAGRVIRFQKEYTHVAFSGARAEGVGAGAAAVGNGSGKVDMAG